MQNKKRIAWNTGKHQTDETKRKIALSLIGNKNNSGLKHSNKWKENAKKRMSGENNPNWNGGKITKKCLTCGKEYKTINAYKNISKYCSRKCIRKDKRQREILRKYALTRHGEKHPCWKGGKTKLAMRIKNSERYKQWRQTIFLRDNFTCNDCNQIGGKLEVHHIKPFSLLVQEAKEYLPLIDWFEACMMYIPLWDIDNGKVLCKECHYKYKGGIKWTK